MKPFTYRARWLGFAAGLLTGLLFVVVIWIYAANFDALLTVNPLDRRHSTDSDTWLWKSVQGLHFCAAMVSGAISAKFSPPRAWGATIALACLVLIASLFAQFPGHHSPLRLAIWILAAPLGLITGTLLYSLGGTAASDTK